MNKFSPTLSYATSYGSTFEQFVEEALKDGFGGVELIPDNEPNLLGQLNGPRRRWLRDVIKQSGLRCVVHSVFYDINLVSVVPEVQRFALDMIEQVSRLAVDLGGREIVVHPGYLFPGWRKSERQFGTFHDAVKRAMSELSSLSTQYEVSYFLENGSYYITDAAGQRLAPLHFGVFEDELNYMLANSGEKVGFCLDMGKAKVSSLDVHSILRRWSSRPFRFQVGGEVGMRRLIDATSATGIRLTDEAVTYEGPPDERYAFMKMHVHSNGGIGEITAQA